ncbi:MAG: hypothetical protein AAGA48_13535 [Myxococcota bacterium]
MIGWALFASAWAQDPVALGSVQQLHASMDSRRTIWTDDATMWRRNSAQARALVSYAAGPVVLERGDDGFAVVRNTFQADLAAAFTVQRVRLGVSVPVLFGVQSDLSTMPGTGLSDASFEVKVGLFEPDVAQLGVAFIGRIGVPVGGAGVPGLATRTPWLEATAVLDGDVGPLNLLANLGARVGAPAVIDDQTVGDQLVGRFAFALPLAQDRLGAAVEVASRVGVRAPLPGTTPVEVGLTGWVRPAERLAIRLGVGRFVVDGLGASAGRAMVAISSQPRLRSDPIGDDGLAEPVADEDAASLSEDRDGDGLRDLLDRCPREPEDADGFEDGDGCPDGVQLGVRIQTRDGAIAHGAFAWLRCNGGEKVRLMPDELIEVPEGSCILDAAGIGWSAKRATRWIDNGPPVEWTVELVPSQPMTRLVIAVSARDDNPLEEVLWSVGNVFGRVTGGQVAMALPVGTYPVLVKARGTAIEERELEIGPEGRRIELKLERGWPPPLP